MEISQSNIASDAKASDSYSVGLRKWACFTALMIAFLVGRASIDWWMTGSDAEAVQFHTRPPRFELDINQATEGQLKALPNIGARLAAAIVEDRRKFGRFQSVDELQRVHGLGPAKLEAMRALIKVSMPPAPIVGAPATNTR